ncbi:hypothetical protein ACN6LM_006815 [Streptomyces sp. SAS_281]|uniref:hypothetical protein n=1 Tax=Streptomyces sp. SAS_281 TaxID=3412744 RepID=UPI00403C749D
MDRQHNHAPTRYYTFAGPLLVRDIAGVAAGVVALDAELGEPLGCPGRSWAQLPVGQCGRDKPEAAFSLAGRSWAYSIRSTPVPLNEFLRLPEHFLQASCMVAT